MTAGIAANLLVLVHLGFILFVVLGGLLVLRWNRLALLHIPCVAWGVTIEFAGWICPLTPLEFQLRELAGEAGYTGGFVDHYILPLVYPGALTQAVQIALGILVLAINLAVYWRVLVNRKKAAVRPE